MKVIKSKLGEILHNCIVHPLLPFLPKKWGDRMHNWSIKYWPSMEVENESCPTQIFDEDEDTENA
jgi:hypothetical protein